MKRAPIVLALLLAACFTAGRDSDGLPLDPAVGSRAFDFELLDVNPRSRTHGRRLALRELYAERGAVLQFVASWCAPCREELPALQELYADGAPIVLMAADEGGQQESLLLVAEHHQLTAPILFVPEDRTEEIERHYTYEIVPATYVIDRKGTITAVHQGAMSKERLAGLIEKGR